ncbi:MAG: DNA-binding protein WhiA [Syntrophomonadaceae bacterium]|jgi:DNA-binding protein WhiA
MSFSHDVRNELARVIPEKECCRKAELLGLIQTGAVVINAGEEKSALNLQALNAATARKIFKLMKESFGLQSTVRIEKRKHFSKTRIYEVITELFSNRDFPILQELQLISADKPNKEVNLDILGKTCCKRSYLRGIFLSRGFINRPEGEYHLEIVFNDERLLLKVQKILNRFQIKTRSFQRKNNLVLYIKESDKISDFLRVVGANRALLNFENVRIIKSMRNTVNRQVNCETANLAKTIDASVRQIDLIKRAMQKEGWTSLPSHLKELAILRTNYPDYTLRELGEMTNPKLSKPGVAYRMRKLEKIAEKIIDEY